jgi:hypothetical protein
VSAGHLITTHEQEEELSRLTGLVYLSSGPSHGSKTSAE